MESGLACPCGSHIATLPATRAIPGLQHGILVHIVNQFPSCTLLHAFTLLGPKEAILSTFPERSTACPHLLSTVPANLAEAECRL